MVVAQVAAASAFAALVAEALVLATKAAKVVAEADVIRGWAMAWRVVAMAVAMAVVKAEAVEEVELVMVVAAMV